MRLSVNHRYRAEWLSPESNCQFFKYWDFDKTGKRTIFTWVTSLPTIADNTYELARWTHAIARMTLGIDLAHGAAFAVHALIGSIGFASCVYLVRRISKLTCLIAGLLTGVLLWFVAQGILAPVIGRPFMIDYGAYTQSSFIGHVGMCAIVGVILRGSWATLKESFDW